MLEIQRLNSTEGERWRSIRLTALHDAPDAFGTTLAEANAFPPELWSRQVGEFPTFIAVLDAIDVGVVRASPDEEQPGAAFLLSMWVAPDARGKGVGEELIDAVAGWAESDGFSRLVLDVADTNASAIALYARKGFEPTGETGTLPSPRQHIREHRRALALPRA
jgi:ribosomal protein S18 acetylase RimI-like enzyme